jgi:hypothetical protein
VPRNVVATVLVVLGSLLAGPAVAAFTMDQQIADQDRYLRAVTPLAADPVVRRAVTDRISGAINDRFGPGDHDLPAPVRKVVDAGVAKVVDSDAFRTAWTALNKAAHPRLVAMLRGQSGSLRIEDDVVLLDLGVVMAEIKARLVADGVPLAEHLPAVDASVRLFSRPAVRRAVPAFSVLEHLGVVLPLTVIALLAAGIVLSTRRRMTLVHAGTGVALAMLLIVLYQWISRGQLIATSQSPPLAGAFYDALTGYLTITLWVVFGVAAAAALAGLLARRTHSAR